MKQIQFLTIMAIAVLSHGPLSANGQVGVYDLWFCLEQCDESNRNMKAVTRATLVLEKATLDLSGLEPTRVVDLDLADSPFGKLANGCLITYINEGDEFDAGIDWFSLVEWRPTSATTLTIEAPQDPPRYTLALWFDGTMAGVGRSGHNAVFVSGSDRAAPGTKICLEAAKVYEAP